MTELYLVAGFLGAGKTTLIAMMARSVFRDKKLVVIENDFGGAGIDAALLQECRLTVASLNGGCICCSMIGEFGRTVERVVKDYAPDVVMVEPSGVGRLSDVIQVCLKQEDRGLIHLRRVITVVDIRSFDKYRKNYGEFFSNQIAYADLILLSHQEEVPGDIPAVEAKIREMNPETRIEADFWESILRRWPRPLAAYYFGFFCFALLLPVNI